MLRPILSYLLLALLLVTNIESTLDSAAGEHPHKQGYAHSLDDSLDGDLGDSVDGYDAASTDSEGNGNHCPHCCHGHTNSISAQFATMHCDMSNQPFSFYPAHAFNYTQAPPTPPPNA